MVKGLADLGLNGRKPFVVMATHRFQARLNRGEQHQFREGT
jgi:hypothetical protein